MVILEAGDELSGLSSATALLGIRLEFREDRAASGIHAGELRRRFALARAHRRCVRAHLRFAQRMAGVQVFAGVHEGLGCLEFAERGRLVQGGIASAVRLVGRDAELQQIADHRRRVADGRRRGVVEQRCSVLVAHLRVAARLEHVAQPLDRARQRRLAQQGWHAPQVFAKVKAARDKRLHQINVREQRRVVQQHLHQGALRGALAMRQKPADQASAAVSRCAVQQLTHVAARLGHGDHRVVEAGGTRDRQRSAAVPRDALRLRATSQGGAHRVQVLGLDGLDEHGGEV